MAPVSGFVQRSGMQLQIGGQPFRIVGGNTYYLGYVKEPVAASVLDLALSMGMNALRIWAFLDAAQAPGANDVCFQFFDNGPRLYDGPNGLERLDRAIALAGDRGIRLILTLTNNWKDFGGMPQYAQWFGMTSDNKNLFYTNQRCREAYRNWVAQLVLRRNTVTGRLYRDEPAILAWELANEPRCEGSGGVDTLLTWTDAMSAFLGALDPNHLIAVGDEGYFRHGGTNDPLYNGGYGVSCEELLGIGRIDFGTAHMYPQSMASGQDPAAFGSRWIQEHIEAGRRANKPMLIEEYGMTVGANGLASEAQRNSLFQGWLDTVERLNGLGDMVWMTGLPKSADQPFDPDGFVISDAAAAPSIGDHARRLLGLPT